MNEIPQNFKILNSHFSRCKNKSHRNHFTKLLTYLLLIHSTSSLIQPKVFKYKKFPIYLTLNSHVRITFSFYISSFKLHRSLEDIQFPSTMNSFLTFFPSSRLLLYAIFIISCVPSPINSSAQVYHHHINIFFLFPPPLLLFTLRHRTAQQ